MRRHIPVLAEAFRFYGAFVAVVTTLVVAFVGVACSLAIDWWVGLMMLPALAIGLALGGLYRAVGNGLHGRRPWARIAALVLSVLVLGDLPFGLPLGLLGLGVLTDKDVTREFSGSAINTATTAEAPPRRTARRPPQTA